MRRIKPRKAKYAKPSVAPPSPTAKRPFRTPELRRHLARIKQRSRRRAQAQGTSSTSADGRQIAADILRTIRHFFPDLEARLGAAFDPRLRRDYSMAEILMAPLIMFVLKQDSRNAMNNNRGKDIFADNYFLLFQKRLPHMDTVNDVLERLTNDELERLKATLVANLIEKKVFGKFRLLDTYYRVAIDGTGVMSVHQGHCDHCLTKTSKNGVVTYFHNALEARLVTPNGFSISLATEWIENGKDYDKQDCELKAFHRLAEKLKRYFPRLPICLHADGLYANKTFFDICTANSWHFIVTLKDGSLKSLWEDIETELLTSKLARTIENDGIQHDYRWLLDLSYQAHTLSWVECLESYGDETSRFVYITSLTIDDRSAVDVAASGRLRFKIENEGFNTLKNLGYGLGRKFSASYETLKNYVSLMQIAHLINQLYELSSLARPLMAAKTTIKHLWDLLVGSILNVAFNAADLGCEQDRFQIRYE